MMVREKDGKFQKVHIFEHNWAKNCFTVKNFYMKGLDLNTKKSILAILKFSNLKRKIAKFLKNQIFERNWSLSYFNKTKFHVKSRLEY